MFYPETPIIVFYCQEIRILSRTASPRQFQLMIEFSEWLERNTRFILYERGTR
jgi:hypothetical protein